MDDAIERIARALCAEEQERWRPLVPVPWELVNTYEQERCRALARHVSRALDAAGLAIVPKEPTEAMIKASCVFNRHHVTDCFKAMLAAGQVRPDAS